MITMNKPQDVEVLQRLKSLPEFRHIVGKLADEYQVTVRELLYAQSHEVEAIRGRARAQYELLNAIAPPK